jgi:hypothetical protein
MNRLNVLRKLLIQGLVVDGAYSFVVILVIAALFATPLTLGSIKNRVYVAVKGQVEKENNAREVTIQQADNVPLDQAFVNDLRAKYPYKMVGNMKSVIMVEGSNSGQIQTIQTLVSDDPRTEALQIMPTIPPEFEIFDLVVSDQLGELLYGKEEWYQLWDTGKFTGMPLTLAVNDVPLAGEFKVIARQTTPGKKIYASEKLGVCLKRYAIGLGCKTVGLPLVPEQVQYSLPKFETGQCFLDFPNNDCDSEQQAKIVKRLKAENFQIEKIPFLVTDINRYQVTLTKFNELKGEIEPTKGDCEQRLSHHLQVCPYTIITPKISLDVNLVQDTSIQKTIQLSGITSQSYELLPGLAEMTNQWGGKELNFWSESIPESGIEMIAPYDVNTSLGMTELAVKGTSMPAFITAYYSCPENSDCPFYAKADMVFRLQNVNDGAVLFQFNEEGLPGFYPTEEQLRIDYDEVLFYAPAVEEVETLHKTLETALPGYNVQYNIYGIEKLKRQNHRLTTLFNLTLWLSVLFILLAVGALAKINVDRRRRQMAQLFVLGYSKFYVSLLLIFEYVSLTVLASILAIGVSWTIFQSASYYLQAAAGQTSTEFSTIVKAMSLDINAFSIVFMIVLFLTIVVASIAAFFASKSDPVELLD